MSVTGFKTCSLLLGILRLEDAAEYPTQEYVLPDLTDFLETEDKSDYPRKATGDDEDLEVVVTQISPGVKSWPYPDNQEGLESSTSPAMTELDSVSKYVCSCVCVFHLSSLLVYYLVFFGPPNGHLDGSIEDSTGPKNLRRLNARTFSPSLEPCELFKD